MKCKSALKPYQREKLCADSQYQKKSYFPIGFVTLYLRPIEKIRLKIQTFIVQPDSLTILHTLSPQNFTVITYEKIM